MKTTSTGTASRTRIKRGQPRPTRRANPARPRKTARAKASRIDALLARLPFTQTQIQRAANWTVAGLAAVAVLVVAQATGVTAKVHEEWAGAVGRAGFEVRRVEVVGADRIDRMKIYDIALAQQNRSMAAVDLEAVRRDLLAHGWVADARVSRRLPDTLVVDIVERTPAAVWQHDQRLSLIDAAGVVLEPVARDNLPDLPLVIGPRANLRSRDLARVLEGAPAMRPLLAGASWVGNRRWDLRFESGEVLALPEGEAAARQALADFARMDGVNRLLGRGIVRFDMRDPERFVLRLPPEGTVTNTEPGAPADAGHDDVEASASAPVRQEEV